MKKQYSAEEKKEYFKKQKQEVEQALIDGVANCYTEGNFRNYLNTLSKFKDYSLNNCMLIAMQMPEATMVAGFNDWAKKFKRHVVKGAKGIRILAPMKHKYDVEETDANGNKSTRTVEYLRFKMVSVFDYSQTEGEDLPQICKPLTGDVSDYQGIVDKLVNKVATVPVQFGEIETTAHGFFNRAEKFIMVQEGMSQVQTIKTLVHEIAHSILHDDAFLDIPTNVKEIQAESVAYMVCNSLGIDSSDYSFEYVASWAKQDMKTLTAQMEVVRKTADAITAQLTA